MATSSKVTDICSKKHARLSTPRRAFAEPLRGNPASAGQGPGGTGGSGIPTAAPGQLRPPPCRSGLESGVPLALGGQTEAGIQLLVREDGGGMLRVPQERPVP